MNIWQEFHGPNAGYVLELYDRFLADPAAVDAATRRAFAALTPAEAALLEGRPGSNGAAPHAAAPADAAPALSSSSGVVRLAQAIREYGHLAARLDPLGTNPPGDPLLSLEAHDLTPAQLRTLPADLVGGPATAGAANAAEAIAALQQVYMRAIGYDYDHLRRADERQWLRDAAESRRFHPVQDPAFRRALLQRLTEVEAFETFLHRTFPGKTRFSIEGLDTMVPILDEVLAGAAEFGIRTIVMGMAHRGRLNVLAHVLQKPYAQILAEFKEPDRSNLGSRVELGWMGDVKYHEGARRSLKSGKAADLSVYMAPNPSHLEHVNPVVEGMVRAADTQVDQPGESRFDHVHAMALLIHGDAAFPGQGIVAETLNFSNISGYRTGGTIHIIANNQLGFTTPALGGRSTLYASDLAKGFKIPIVHVNADDVEACIEVARLAFAYRARFEKDFLIDLVGYRRYGHNEGDEPRFTQPMMYARVDAHPTARARWAQQLEADGALEAGEAEALLETHVAELRALYDGLEPEAVLPPPEIAAPPAGAARKTDTRVAAAVLRASNQALLALPHGFAVNKRLQRVLSRRATALDDDAGAAIDWGHAEALAFASILADGTAIRLTGEDAERGTFSHRHAVLHDAANGALYVPLQHLPGARAAFEVRNSPLSENAAVGFEYGYNIQAPDRLCLWEAQYGDFVNGAQAMIDQFLVSGRAKWEQTPSLVMLLPHGHEGQGPDHSTGRLERFLQAAAETNMRIANCTTAGQYFHLLRRQALLLTVDPLPLVLMAPKSLLRHPLAASSLVDLATGRWHPVLDDPSQAEEAAAARVRRLVFCSGKVYVDLATAEERAAADHVAIVRLEQLYPFPDDALRAVIARYAAATEFVWLQEEPANMGAWEYLRAPLGALIADRGPLGYIGRPRAASPAEGSSAFHRRNQEKIVASALAGV